MWYRYLHSHTWESPHFGSETFDTKKATSEIPPFLCITPKRPAKTRITCPCLQHPSVICRWPWCSSWFGYVAKFKRLAAGLGVVSLTFNQQQLEVDRQWTWRKSGSNKWAKTKLGKMWRRSGEKQVCMFTYWYTSVVMLLYVAISKHKGMFSMKWVGHLDVILLWLDRFPLQFSFPGRVGRFLFRSGCPNVEGMTFTVYP